MSRAPHVALLLLWAVSVQAQSVDLVISEVPVPDGAVVGVRGDTPPLAWDRSLPLEAREGIYATSVAFPTGTGPVAYKVVVESPGGEVTWEPGGNRVLFPGRMAADRRAFGADQTDLPARTLSQAELAEDLDVLRRVIVALHPGLPLHLSDAELDAISTRLWQGARDFGEQYGEAVPMPEVYLLVTEAVAAIRDGHTRVSMYNQSGTTQSLLYGRADRVPFAFRLVGDRMIVTGDATADRVLPRGTEILTLNGIAVPDVIAALMRYASADGANDAKRRDELEVSDVLAPAQRFDVIYSLLYQPEGDHALTIRRPDGTEADLSVAPTTQRVRRDTLWARDPSLPRTDADLLRYRLDPDGTAVIAIGSFATFNMDVDYDAWLVGAFRQMREAGAERLVVDLRDVAGGMDDAATLLFRHLLAEPVEVSRWSGHAAYDRVPDDIRPYVSSWSDDFLDLSARVTPAEDGTFRFPVRPPARLEPAPDAFTGPTAVLVDATASSATFYLAQAIQESGAAVLVGQETGGSLRGLNAGQVAFLTLPNSGVVIDLPLIGSRPPTPGPDRGVTPDVVVPLDAEAVMAGRDPEMEAALARLGTSMDTAADRP